MRNIDLIILPIQVNKEGSVKLQMNKINGNKKKTFLFSTIKQTKIRGRKGEGV